LRIEFACRAQTLTLFFVQVERDRFFNSKQEQKS